MDILCRNGCGGPYHEATEKFDPEKSPHGGMFRLKEPYRGNSWSSFPEHEGVTGQAIECPNCGSPYADVNGRVRLDNIRVPSAEEQSCSVVIDTKSPEAIDMQIRAMALAGKKPGEIGKALGIHHLTVAKRIKAMG